jgi:hypothetical protein
MAKHEKISGEETINNILGIIDQHYALIIITLFITQAPTCFDTYVSSSGIVLYPCELLKIRNCCVIGMYPVLDDTITSILTSLKRANSIKTQFK